MKKLIPALLFCSFLATVSRAQPKLALQTFATGFSQPVDIANNGSTDLYVVEKQGKIKRVDSSGTISPTLFLNISTLVSNGGEQGLLGMCFHPNYAVNGYIYVNYTNTGGDTRIVRYTRSATNPAVIDNATALTIYSVNQPFANHNAGDLEFGPDGFLYFGLGDGGSGGDPGNRSQNLMNALGKMIRLNVDSGVPYSVPSSNPYVGQSGALPEIWASGLRNPFKFSFDRLTGDMWIGDVGQNLWEEIDFEPANSSGGNNWGWRCYEGFHPYNTTGCQPIGNYDFPVFDYPHSSAGGYSVTGGYVYRGSNYPDLQGWYVMNDYVSANFWLLKQGGATLSDTIFFPSLMGSIVAYGEDANGELYVGSLTSGSILKVTDACQGLNATVTASLDTLIASTGTAYQWFLNGSPISGEMGKKLRPSSAGSYTVRVTFANGCTKVSAPFSFQPSAIDDGGLLSGEVTVFPNPSNGEFSIEVSGAGSLVRFSVSDATGRMVEGFSGTALASNGIGRINLSAQPAGVYFLKVSINDREEVRRLVLLPN